MKFFVLFFICIFSTTLLWAQVPEQQPEPITINASPAGSSLYGKILDKNTGKPIVAASVQMYAGINSKDTLFDGMISKHNGEFNFTRLPGTDSIRLMISALGYETQEQTLLFPAPAMDLKITGRIWVIFSCKLISSS
jgi:hypothetical protein